VKGRSERFFAFDIEKGWGRALLPETEVPRIPLHPDDNFSPEPVPSWELFSQKWNVFDEP
jgi:hypothetical protein